MIAISVIAILSLVLNMLLLANRVPAIDPSLDQQNPEPVRVVEVTDEEYT